MGQIKKKMRISCRCEDESIVVIRCLRHNTTYRGSRHKQTR